MTSTARAKASVGGIGPLCVLTALAVSFAIVEARQDWSGIQVDVGFGRVGLSIYPPFALALAMALRFGPAHALVPAYASTLASGLVAGMPLATAALFALATPVEVVLVWCICQALNVQATLRR